MKDKDRCQGTDGYCTKKALSPHVCPFQSEINDDQTECDCCEECEASCADEI